MVLIPEQNTKDLKGNSSQRQKCGLEIVPVRWFDQVIELALVAVTHALCWDEQCCNRCTLLRPVLPTNAPGNSQTLDSGFF